MKKLHPYAKTGFILALFFWVPALNYVTNVLAIVFGAISLKESQDLRSRGFSITAITIGIVALIASIAFPIIYYYQGA